MAKRSAKVQDDPFSPGHHVGQFHGYYVRADGAIELSPGLTDPMNDLTAEAIGLRRLLETTNEHVATRFSRISKDRRAWWKRVADDIGIDPADNWVFDGVAIKKCPPPEPKE